MIKIKDLSVQINSVKILNKINITLPHYGLIGICGPSGCGKTTLLNCLGGILNYDGQIEIDGCSINNLNNKELSEYRIKNIGFVFQDFKLFECENLIQNVLFPLDMISNSAKERKNRKVNDLLDVVNLKNIKCKDVSKLSGGEKQRVAIARALVNDPKIVLADEPTGALDSKNSEDIMKILSKISQKSLVIVVSHDKKLISKYADQIINMSDGEIENNEFLEKRERNIFLPVCQNLKSNKKPSIGLGFLFRHAKNSYKSRKWRSMICTSITSLGLIGVGLAISLSSSISSNIKSAYSSIIDDDKIMVSLKEDRESNWKEAANEIEVENLMSFIDESNIGVCYINDFESMFKDANSFSVESGNYWTEISNISVRNINEFVWLDQNKDNIYPHTIDDLKNEEIILGINYPIIEKICYCLKIPRTLDSLSSYLKAKTFDVCFEIKNEDWRYWEQLIFSVKGFALMAQPTIIHNNHRWNEYVFEKLLSFPTTNSINTLDQTPWTLRKCFYFQSNDMDTFIETCYQHEAFNEYILEIANSSFYPWLLKNIDVSNVDRVLVFKRNCSNIPSTYFVSFKEIDSNISSPIFGTDYGYCIYPDYLMMGFARTAYFSSSELLIDSVIDDVSIGDIQNQNEYTLPQGIYSGHYSKSMQNGIIFETFAGNLVFGRECKSLDEICISTKLYKEIFKTNIYKEQVLKCGFTTEEKLYNDGSINRVIKKIDLKVVGVVESSRLSLFHKPFWTISFFQSRLGISAFNLQIKCIAITVKKQNKIETTINNLKRAFPKFEIVNPMTDINKSVDQICLYIEIALIAFSTISITISIILLTLCNSMHIQESKRDIGLAICLGARSDETIKFVFSNTLFLSLSSFLSASFELLFISFITSFEISKVLASNMLFEINPLSILFMLILSLLISFISSAFLVKSIKRKNPLELLKK